MENIWKTPSFRVTYESMLNFAPIEARWIDMSTSNSNACAMCFRLFNRSGKRLSCSVVFEDPRINLRMLQGCSSHLLHRWPFAWETRNHAKCSQHGVLTRQHYSSDMLTLQHDTTSPLFEWSNAWPMWQNQHWYWQLKLLLSHAISETGPTSHLQTFKVWLTESESKKHTPQNHHLMSPAKLFSIPNRNIPW